MADVSKSAKWAKRLAVVTLACGAIIGAAFLMPFEDHGDFSGLFHAMAVGMVTAVFGGIGLLSSVIGTVMTVSVIRRHHDWSPTTKFAATVHSLAFVAIGVVVICVFTIWTPRARSHETGLGWAVTQQDIAAAKKELKKGANPSQKLWATEEPLIVTAIRHQNREMIHLLLDHGANPDCIYDVYRSKTPLYLVLDQSEKLSMSDAERLEIAKLLLEHGAKVTPGATGRVSPLLAAIGWGEKSVIEMLIRYGADPNVPCGPYNQTPLGYAVDTKNTRSVGILLELGVNVNARSFRQSDVTVVFNVQDPQMLDFLCSHGANVNLGRDGAGRSALGNAVFCNRPEMVRSLLAHGAHVNARTADDLLSCARHAKNPEITKMIEEAVAQSKASTGGTQAEGG